MGTLKNILKLICGLLIGISAGFLIATIAIVAFTDITLSEFMLKLKSTSLIEVVLSAAVGIVGFLVSLSIVVVLHEGGHLVCGLISGYKFVSFRVFNLTFIRSGGKLRVKKFSVAGTGGQCLLTPPDLPLKEIPTVWYNAGGILVNLLLLLVSVPLLWLNLNSFVTEFVVIFILTDLFLLIMNAIPMQANGISNDAYNMIHLRNNLMSKRALMVQLHSNALIQDGVRPKDMPDEWFEWRGDVNWKNALEVSIPMMHASRLIDKMEWDRAYTEFETMYKHKGDIMQLYVSEIACELIFCSLVTGRIERAKELLDSKLRKSIEAYRNVMSSKQRVLSAIAMYLDNDEEKAVMIYETLKTSQPKYLLQGEVKSDLAIMETFLNVE